MCSPMWRSCYECSCPLSGVIMQAASFADDKTKDIVLALFCLRLRCLSSDSFHVTRDCFSLGQLRIKSVLLYVGVFKRVWEQH